MARRTESADRTVATTFPSELGWMAALWSGQYLSQLVFGSSAPLAARRRLELASDAEDELTDAMEDLVARLQQFTSGAPDDFRDVQVDFQGRTRFQRAVLEQCRAINCGAVVTYGELAARAGYPRSARAVGNVMASNRVPLIIPCHRVVASGGKLGGYSAPDGLLMKRRLLKLEGAALPAGAPT